MKFTILRREFKKMPKAAECAVVIGNFDGIHKGHKHLIQKAVELAKAQNLTPALYTFEPHPKKLFMGENAPKPITTFAPKAKLIQNLGVELLVAMPFTKKFASMHFKDFAKHLKNDLNVRVVIVGEDFTFGKDREGTAKKLKDIGKELGFEVYIAEDIGCEDVARISSSRIREALISGAIDQANSWLGRPFSVRGFLSEDNMCNLVLKFLRHTPIKNGVYLAKIQYTNASLKIAPCVIPLSIKKNVGYIAPLPEMPNLLEGHVTLSLMSKIEE